MIFQEKKSRQTFHIGQATGNSLVVQATPDSDKTKEAFIPKSTILWNNLPLSIKRIQVLLKFKYELRNWVRNNIEI